MPTYPTTEQWWIALLTGNPAFQLRRFRRIFRLLPSNTRCKFCNAPMEGPGVPLMRLIGQGPSSLTPYLCRRCEILAGEQLGGAEVELTLLFADVRGSTPLAERLGSADFRQIINRFYAVSAEILIKSDAWIEKFVGDQIDGLYLPGFAGPRHARLAVEAAQDVLRATGHANADGPWAPVGVGVHTGIAFVGAIGVAGRATDITVLGDSANTAARLASKAAAGEVLISDAAYAAVGLDLGPLEQRQLELKGKSEPVGVHVLRVTNS